MSVQMIPAYVLQVLNWVQPAIRIITIHATREGVETPDYKVCRIYSSIDKNEMAVDIPLRDGIESSMTFLADAIDGSRAFMLIDTQPERYGAVRLINVDSDLDININLTGVAEDTRGHGILSGSFPISLLTENNQLPNQAQIRVLYRPTQGEPGDGIVVATTTCNVDGTWQVSGLNENLKFDIVARIPGFNDVIISDVQPTGAPLSAHFAGVKEEYEYEEKVNIQVVALGGRPPYVFEAVSLPDGLSMDAQGNITGSIVSTTDVSFDVTVTDSESTVVTASADSYVDGDPHWDKVVALLHFDGDLINEADLGDIWTISASTLTPDGFFDGGLNRAGGADSSYSGKVFNLVNDSWTIEFFIRRNLDTAVYSALVAFGRDNLLIRQNPTGTIEVYAPGNIALFNGIDYPVGVWLHLAVQRDDVTGAVSLYIDGVLINSITHNPPINNRLDIGFSNKDPNNAHFTIDELRITKGVARYTENFTPPTKPFPNL